jgi:hypothetical protein
MALLSAWDNILGESSGIDRKLNDTKKDNISNIIIIDVIRLLSIGCGISGLETILW